MHVFCMRYSSVDRAESQNLHCHFSVEEAIVIAMWQAIASDVWPIESYKHCHLYCDKAASDALADFHRLLVRVVHLQLHWGLV